MISSSGEAGKPKTFFSPALRLAAKVHRFFFGEIDPIRIDTFRFLLGISMLLYFATWWQHAGEWLTTEGYHVSSRVFGHVPQLPPLSPKLLPPFTVFFFVSILLWTAGVKTRVTSITSFLSVSYVTLVDVFAAYTLNKLYMVSLLVFVLIDHGYYWTALKRPVALTSAWPVRVLQATIIIQYFCAGYAKMIFGDWLENPHVLWSHLQGVYMTDTAAWVLNHAAYGTLSWFQYTALTFEVFCPILFCFKPLRPAGLLLGLGFQTMIALTMDQLFFFSFQMVVFYVLFLSDHTLHGVRNFLARTKPS